VGADHPLGQTTYDGGLALRVDTLATHGLAQPLVERLDQLSVSLDGVNGHRDPSPE
jgi:hypothetical protein